MITCTRGVSPKVMSSLRKELLKSGLPPLPPGGLSHRSSSTGAGRRRRNYSPLPWSDFFDKCEDVLTPGNNCFRVYFRGSSGPVLLLLHGGGHSALSWSLFVVAITKLVDCQVIAVDIRGHGGSKTTNDDDLTAQTLVNDVVELLKSLFDCEVPPVVIMGHSMGGAIAIRVAAEQSIPSLIGLAVIDVVEGTAIDSLATMQSFLRGRPKVFDSLDHAIEWSIRSGQLRNVESARVSMPGQLTQCSASSVATDESTSVSKCYGSGVAQQPVLEEPTPEQTKSGSEEGKGSASNDDKSQTEKYTWRIDLTRTESFWRGWFEGLSELFLSTSAAKLLILAGVDRLDKNLTIGQMQGKFQMEVLTKCGHSVHEDAPDKVAQVVANFLIRHKITVAI